MTAKTGGLARTQPTIFGVPSLETARRLMTAIRPPPASGALSALPRMRELEQQFDAKASEPLAAFAAACGEIIGRGEQV